MKFFKIILFASLLIGSFPKTIWAQVNPLSVSDPTDDDDSAVVDPDYKPLTKTGNTVGGKWYGIGNVVTTSQSNSYLCELLLKEDKKGNVTGYFNYFFRDGYFSNKLYGTYDKSAQTFKFKPVIVLFHQSVKADIGVDVPMFGNFILNLNSKDTTLTGFLTPISNYKYMVPALNIKLSIVAKNEPTLKERIRRRKLELEEDPDVATVMDESKKDSTTTSDNKNVAKEINTNAKEYQNDSLKFAPNKKQKTNDHLKFSNGTSKAKGRDIISSQGTIKSQTAHDKIASTTQQQNVKARDTLHFHERQNKKYGSDSLNFKNRMNAKSNDTIRYKESKQSFNRDTLKFNDQVASVQKAVEEEYKHRTNNLVNTLVVNDDSVTISLYDNGEFDHDMVSVFFNGKLIASNVELKTNAASKFVVHLETEKGAKNELTLFAENLGTIPPNSALMIIEDTHNNRYEVTLKSDLSHNASVLLTPKLE